MKRTIPTTGSEAIRLYMRTYYSLLRTSAEVQIQTLVESHLGMDSLLHALGREHTIDVSALVYCSLRLPRCIRQVRSIVMGQSRRVFAQRGLGELESWQPVVAPGRRRRMYFDGDDTLAVYVASLSDIDDIVPMLTAFQIEWNKMYLRLRDTTAFPSRDWDLSRPSELDQHGRDELRGMLEMPPEDLGRLQAIWGDDLPKLLSDMAASRKRMTVRLLAGSQVEYRKATQSWWTNIADSLPFDISERPVYFVSSNTHSVVNMLSGFALRRSKALAEFVENSDDGKLRSEYRDILAEQVPSSRENFYYYVLKKYLRSDQGSAASEDRDREEAECGITHIQSRHVFDVTAQVVELRSLKPDWVDSRLRIALFDRLASSDAVILNIDYPLGTGAYHILSQVAASIASFRGVYILGKAATLNGRIGDVLVPNVVHDEHSRNTYLLRNCFTAGDISPYVTYGAVLDNQKAVSVRSTFLQNRTYMNVFHHEGFTDIEMEAGPYLSAVYESLRPRRYPQDEIVNLYSIPYDVGIIHYASDTPISKGKSLGAHYLSYYGMDPTYAGTIAILRRILDTEVQGSWKGQGK